MLLSPMQTLRRLRWLARLVLAGFVMSMGVAVATPMLHPQALELICSGPGAVALRVQTDDGAKPQSGHQLDCPLCVQVGAPAPGLQADQPRLHPSAQACVPALSRIALRALPRHCRRAGPRPAFDWPYF